MEPRIIWIDAIFSDTQRKEEACGGVRNISQTGGIQPFFAREKCFMYGVASPFSDLK
jgi:hypothetical protein